MLEIWSGGQTGVDRAALDVALELGLATGGWVPKGKLAEDGRIPERYAALRESSSADSSVRTEWNVRDTDATLLLHFGEIRGGTELARLTAERLGKPMLAVDLSAVVPHEAAARIRAWLRELPPGARVNVAGPRASEEARAYSVARGALRLALAR
jgi:hypothetical protein